MTNKTLKLFGAVGGVQVLENVILLLLYGIDIFTKQNLILLLLSTFTITLVLKHFGLLKEC